MHKSTGFSPARLLYGADVRLPADIVFNLPSPTSTDMHTYVRSLDTSLRKIHVEARHNADLAHASQEQFYNRRVHGEPYVVGQQVYLHDPVIRACEHRKFYRFWSGPHTIVRVHGPTSYTLLLNGVERTVHFNRLKPVTSSCPVSLPSSVHDLPDPVSLSANNFVPVVPHDADDSVPSTPPISPSVVMSPLRPPVATPVLVRRSGRIRTAPVRFGD